MSAITGIFYNDGRTVKPELIKKMNNRLSHRGPDGSSVWSNSHVGFGHQKLWTTSESLHEILPFHDEKSSLTITADARIDNRKELSEELDIEDIEEVSDSYFILKSYEKWGESCPEHLIGDFSFAIWDENERETVLCKRSYGYKIFLLLFDENMFVFGTEVKALFCVTGVPYELNEQKLALFLIKDILDKNMTFYKMIKGLEPSHSLTITKSGFLIKNIGVGSKKRDYYGL